MVLDHAAPAAPEALEGWLAAHPRAVSAGVLAAALLVRLVLVLQLAGGPLPSIHRDLNSSDNAFFDTWGRHIAAGDLLQREPFHPMVLWMQRMARQALAADPTLAARSGLADGSSGPAAETAVWDRWLGGATFYQEPGYPYLVGGTYALAGPRPWAVFAWQLAVGVLGTFLVLQLGRRMASQTAGLAAALLAILAPIPLVFEVILLRDGLVAFATVALAWLMGWTVEGGRRRWFVLGLAFGAATLLKTSLLAFPALMIVWRLATHPVPWRERLSSSALVVAGMTLALSPAILRNLVVGVSPLALNGSAAAMLASFHTSQALPNQLAFGDDFARVLAAGDGRLLASLVEAARTHASGWSLAALELKRLALAWHGFEAINNVDFYVFRQGAPILALLPATVVVVTPLAALGAVAVRRDLARAWPVLLAVLAALPSLVLAGALSRYRASLTAALLPLAGAGAVQLWAWVRLRRWFAVAAAAAATAAYLAWATADLPGQTRAELAAYYKSVSGWLLVNAPPALPTLYLREARRLAPDEPLIQAWLGAALLASGKTDEGVRLVEDAAPSLQPNQSREIQEFLGRLHGPEAVDPPPGAHPDP